MDLLPIFPKDGVHTSICLIKELIIASLCKELGINTVSEAFQFSVLKVIEDKADLMKEEQVFIDELKISKQGYNVSTVASGVSLQESPSDIWVNFRLPDQDIAILEAYCKKTGATKTGTIRMLLRVLKDEQLLAIVSKSITLN